MELGEDNRLGPGWQAPSREWPRGVAADTFLTPPLWGLAQTRPYLHDGRASTIGEAVMLHGGEALDARDAYAELDDAARAPLRVFLTSLTRARRLVAR